MAYAGAFYEWNLRMQLIICIEYNKIVQQQSDSGHCSPTDVLRNLHTVYCRIRAWVWTKAGGSNPSKTLSSGVWLNPPG